MFTSKMTKWMLSAALALSAPVVALGQHKTHLSAASAQTTGQLSTVSTGHHKLSASKRKTASHHTSLHSRRLSMRGKRHVSLHSAHHKHTKLSAKSR